MTLPRSEISAGDASVVFDAVSKRFAASGGNAAFTALNNVSLTVARGSITGIIGRSGAGKSTLIRLVNGLEKPSGGKVFVDGVDVGELDEAGLRDLRRSVGMIFQHFNLLSSRTVFGNVALPLEIAGMDRRAIERRVRPLLDLVGLADKHGRYPAELSGGQKQRIGIARALALNPTVIVADEATSALDVSIRSQILDLMIDIQKQLHLSFIFISHDISVVRYFCDRVAVMHRGKIVEVGDAETICTNPSQPYTRRLISSVPNPDPRNKRMLHRLRTDQV
ncbi:methionine ABC transporter ATP-binding protein [Sinorhizobium medicae]|nr:methionine ABC transporter ATP-binding protein [Sinorhizobium medicae]